MTARRPPSPSTSTAASSALGSVSSSRFTAMRSAWNTRVAGWTRRRPRGGAGAACATTSASWAPVSIGSLDARGDDCPRNSPRVWLFAVLPEQHRQFLLVHRRRSARWPDAARRVEAHVERSLGAKAERALCRRPAGRSSSPRSKSTPSAGTKPASAAASSRCSKFVWRSVTRSPKSLEAPGGPRDGRRRQHPGRAGGHQG